MTGSNIKYFQNPLIYTAAWCFADATNAQGHQIRRERGAVRPEQGPGRYQLWEITR